MTITDKITLTSAIVGLLTFIATAFYVVLTYKQLSLLESSYQLERRPYLVFKGLSLAKLVDAKSGKTHLEVGISLQNSGKLLLSYKIKHGTVHLNQESQVGAAFVNNGGYIFPNQESIFRFGAAPIDDAIAKAIGGDIEYEAEYQSSEGGQVFHSKRKIRFELSIENGAHRFWYLNEEES